MGFTKHIGRSSASTCYGNCAIAGTFKGCCEIQSSKKKIIKEKPDRIYIKFTVISIYQWNQLPTHHPVQFFLYLQMCWYQTNGEEDERCLKEGGNERQMRRCVRVKQKKEQHVYALCSPLLHFSLFYACCVFLKVLSFFVTFLPAPHFFSPVAALCGLGRKDDGWLLHRRLQRWSLSHCTR